MGSPAKDDRTCLCLHCGHQWRRRVASPQNCPRCITPNWRKVPRKGNYPKGDQHHMVQRSRKRAAAQKPKGKASKR